jgi:phage shock protein C
MLKNKKLTRSTNATISGVLGGIGDMFDIDPVFIRVLYIMVTAFTGFVPGIVAYFIMMIIVPARS